MLHLHKNGVSYDEQAEASRGRLRVSVRIDLSSVVLDPEQLHQLASVRGVSRLGLDALQAK